MADRLYRTQVLLKPEQHAKLAQIARQEGRSVSEVVREVIDNELQRRDELVNEDIKRRLEGLERIQRFREELLAERGGQPLDIDVVAILDQVRREQDERNYNLSFGTGD